MFFFRGNDKNQTTLRNLIGVDLVNGFQTFSLTGSEFNGGLEITPDIGLEEWWGPENMNIQYVNSPTLNVIYFTARYRQAPVMAFQAFALDIDHPFAAFPVTSFNNVTEEGIIDNLVVSEDALMLAFSRSNRIDQLADQAEKIFAVDLLAYGFMRDVTPDSNYDWATVDGSLHFIPGDSSPPNPRGPQLVYVVGPGTGGANNPFPARAWAYPLIHISNPGMTPAISYPLTEAGSVFIFNALP
jgi:hypothetical protein